jgi:transketolase
MTVAGDPGTSTDLDRSVGGDPDRDEVARIAAGIRRRVLAHTVANDGGYLSQACSAAEMLATLYGGMMRLGPSEGPLVPPPFEGVPGPGRPRRSGAAYNGPEAPDLDRFVFSPAHYALVLYATLIETDRLSEDALDRFNADGSTVEMIGAEHSPGFESTTGSLAQALSYAGGVALARRLRGDTGHVWVFMSDGEFQEGQTWEAANALAFHGIGNLTVLVDVNGQQCDGPMDTVMRIEPLADRLRAFGAVTHDVDGHDVDGLVDAVRDREPDRPTFVLGRTDPCRGIDVLRERAPLLHYVRFTSPEEKARFATAQEGLDR